MNTVTEKVSGLRRLGRRIEVWTGGARQGRVLVWTGEGRWCGQGEGGGKDRRREDGGVGRGRMEV